jgi:hypothetical protein
MSPIVGVVPTTSRELLLVEQEAHFGVLVHVVTELQAPGAAVFGLDSVVEVSVVGQHTLERNAITQRVSEVRAQLDAVVLRPGGGSRERGAGHE